MTALRVTRFALLLIVAWTVMVVSHEAGHVVGGFLAGASLTALDLAPWRLPYSLHSPDPYPLVTLWSGPIIGVAVPVIAAMFVRNLYADFVADFCLIANGGYLAVAAWAGDRHLDTARLMAAGTPAWTVGVFRSAISAFVATASPYCRRHPQYPKNNKLLNQSILLNQSTGVSPLGLGPVASPLYRPALLFRGGDAP